MEKWSETETIATWIVIALLVVTLFAFLVIKLIYVNFKRQIQNQQIQNQLQIDYQKKLIETSVVVQERERDRIASDLHDSLIGKLTTLRLQQHLEQNASNFDASLEECIAEARRISHDLTPPMIKYIVLEVLIEEIVSSWNSSYKISFYKSIVPIELDDDYKLQIIRILQEVMVNTHKHAECTLVKIHLRISRNKIAMIIKDNGKGFDLQQQKKGLGLQNIELRVIYLNGFHKMKSGNNGTISIFLFNICK